MTVAARLRFSDKTRRSNLPFLDTQSSQSIRSLLPVILDAISECYDTKNVVSRQENQEIHATCCAVLDRLGFKVRMCIGYLVLDVPIDGDIDVRHTWVGDYVKGTKIDLTSRQFRGHIEDESLVGEFFMGTSDRFVEAVNIPPENEWFNRALVEKCLVRLVRDGLVEGSAVRSGHSKT